MEERLSPRRERGLNRNTLQIIGLVLMSLGMMGQAILQNRLLASGASLEETLSASTDAMNAAATSLILQAFTTMAVPIFAVLTLDGFQHTSSVKKYLLRLLGLALVSELPYHLARTGKLWEYAPRNPVFGLVIAVSMLYLLRSYPGGDFKGIAVKILALIAGCLWCYVFQVEYGVNLVLIVYVLWIFRERHTMAYLAGSAIAVMFIGTNPLFVFAPFGFVFAHFYNGTQRLTPRLLRYALYPLSLLLIAAAATIFF